MNKFIVSAQALKRFLISCIEKEAFKQYVSISIRDSRLSINGYSITIENNTEFSFDLNVYQIETLIKLLSLIEDQPMTVVNEGQSSIILNNISI